MLTGGMRAGPMALLILYVVVLFGAIYGANAGFTAENASQTDIYIEGDTLVSGNNETKVSFDAENTSKSETYEQAESTSPTFWLANRYGHEMPQILPDSVHHPIQNSTMAFAERMYWGALHITVGVADVTATWTYHNRWWLPQWLVAGVFQFAAAGPFAIFGYSVFRRFKEAKRQ